MNKQVTTEKQNYANLYSGKTQAASCCGGRQLQNPSSY